MYGKFRGSVGKMLDYNVWASICSCRFHYIGTFAAPAFHSLSTFWCSACKSKFLGVDDWWR